MELVMTQRMPPVWERCVRAQGYRRLARYLQAVETGIEEELLTSNHLDKAYQEMEGTVGEIPELISHDPLLQQGDAERTRSPMCEEAT